MKRHVSFFRQSGWMVIATFAGGLMMMMVHTVARKMGPEEYDVFVTLLSLLVMMGTPATALQTIFARQAAAVTNEADERQLIATTRGVLVGLFLLWLVLAGAAAIAIQPLSNLLKISNPIGLYFTLLVALATLALPVSKGLLQGQHRFGGLGWMMIIEGAGRFGVLVLVVLGLHGKASAGMFAVLVGQMIAIVIGAWLTRGIWGARSEVAFRWKNWLGESLPLTLGLGTVLVMYRVDQLFVQSVFTDSGQKALYCGAGLTGFAIIQFIAPVALVMFARVTKSAARAERSDSLGMTLAATLIFGVLAGVGCTVLPKLPLKVMYFSNPEMLAAAPLVPWFAWALLPLTLANVLVQNILAQKRFRAVPWLMLVLPGYLAALYLQKPTLLGMPQFDAFVRIIQTLGLASTALCLIAAWFTVKHKTVSVSDPVLEAVPAVSGIASAPRAQKGGAAL